MKADTDASPIDAIIRLADEIVNQCPSCAARASEIALWAKQIRERRPSRAELEALVDLTCQNALAKADRERLVEGLRALVRFAE